MGNVPAWLSLGISRLTPPHAAVPRSLPRGERPCIDWVSPGGALYLKTLSLAANQWPVMSQ